MIALLSCSVSGWSDAHYPVDWDWRSSAMGRCHENILYADCCLGTLVAITTPTIGVSKIKLWWKNYFLQKCKMQVNTSSWHSQLCGLLLWHSAKVLTGFIKSFISKLANCSKKVKWLWEFDLTESFKYLWGKFPWQAPIIHLPIPSAAWCPVSRPVSTQRHIHTHPLLTSGTQSQSPVQAFGTLWLQYYILKFTISE